VSKAPDWLQLGYPYTPYCGLPPGPRELLQHWNLDPLLLGVLIVALVAYAAGSEPRGAGGGGKPVWRRLCFYGGWALGAAALVSPLCALSVSLFSARAGEDMLLAMVVAPLIALGRPGAHTGRAPARLLRRTYAGARVVSRQPILAAIAFAAVLWIWHAPGAYAATFDSGLLYWIMRLSSFAAALWLSSALLGRIGERNGGLVIASLLTALQMGLLAAAIAFAGRQLYLPHVLTAAAWGLTPLGDQQLGGALIGAFAAAVLAWSLALAVAVAGHHQPAPGGSLA
jgi:putative membrane protein